MKSLVGLGGWGPSLPGDPQSLKELENLAGRTVTSWKTSHLRLDRKVVNTVQSHREQEQREQKTSPPAVPHQLGQGPGKPHRPSVGPGWGRGGQGRASAKSRSVPPPWPWGTRILHQPQRGGSEGGSSSPAPSQAALSPIHHGRGGWERGAHISETCAGNSGGCAWCPHAPCFLAGPRGKNLCSRTNSLPTHFPL